MERVRLAVVGAGRQCTRSIMPGIPEIPEIELVAVCDLQEELALRNATAFGAGAWYSDLELMLSDQKPDAVVVVGPPAMHEEVGIACFQAGCHVFTEKPSSPTVEGARRLAKAGAESGKLGQIGHMMRHAEAVRLAREITEREEFGAILSVESKYTTWPTGTMDNPGWGHADADWSYMLVQGGHPIDLIRHFLGPIARVYGRRAKGNGNAKVYGVTVESVDGKVGYLNLQDSYDGWSTKLEIVGDGKALITVDDLQRLTYRTGSGALRAAGDRMGYGNFTWEPHFTAKMGVRAGYQNQLQAFAQSILADTPPFPSLEDGWRNLVVSRCIVESCASGQAVEVPQETL